MLAQCVGLATDGGGDITDYAVIKLLKVAVS